MTKSIYFKSMHPKTEISPTLSAVERILRAGWIGQPKINGHRAQIHIHASPDREVLVYNRQGRLHRAKLSDTTVAELRRILSLTEGWTVLDGEWIKPKRKIFLFDLIKLNGVLLRHLSYGRRHALLPRDYLSPYIQTLPLLRTVDRCMAVLRDASDSIEGLVFKSPAARGFSDSSIVRCRKSKRGS